MEQRPVLRRVSGHIQSQFTACSNGLDIKDFKEVV